MAKRDPDPEPLDEELVEPELSPVGERLRAAREEKKLSLEDLAETSEVGDWKMPEFKAACTYAASQGWLVVRNDALTLTMAGLAAA